MKIVLVTLVVVFLICVSGVWAVERLAARHAERTMSSGDPTHAYALYTSLLRQKLWFVDRDELIGKREAAAAQALTGAMRAHEFSLASDLMHAVLRPPDTGYEAAVRVVQADLPEQHLDHIEQLFVAAQLEQALAQCGVAARLYVDQPRVLERVGALNRRTTLSLAERALSQGDTVRLVALLEGLDNGASIGDELTAARILSDGAGRRADWYERSRDFAGVLEWFRTTHDRLERRPNLAHALSLVYADFARRVFELPLSTQAEAVDVDLPPPMIETAATNDGYGVVTITNRADRPLTVLMRGERDYRIPGPLAIGASLTLRMRPGAYAQIVHAGSIDPAPYVGVVRVKAFRYSQQFAVREHEDAMRTRRRMTAAAAGDE